MKIRGFCVVFCKFLLFFEPEKKLNKDLIFMYNTSMIAIIILAVIIVLLLLYIWISYFVYGKIFYTPNKHQLLHGDEPMDAEGKEALEKINDLFSALKNEPYEEVFIESFDDLKLRGRFYQYHLNAPIAICFHGYRGNPVRDFCGGFDVLKKLGYNILLVDHRGHEKSEGHTITLGIKEKRDVLSWTEYVNDRFGEETKILLCGISMGAYSVLACAATYELPSNVKGVFADCPYNSPKDIVSKVCKHDLHVPLFIGYPFLFLAATMFGKFNLKSIDLSLRAEKIKVPALIIHGDADTFVPPYMSKAIVDNNPSIEYYLFEGAGHGLSFVIDKDRYYQIAKEFTDKIMK